METDDDQRDSEQDMTPDVPEDPCPSLSETHAQLDSLHDTISGTSLFDLCWDGSDFVPHSFIETAENEINKAVIVAERGEIYTDYLIELSSSVTKAAEELSVLVKEKLASEFEIVKPKANWTKEQLERLYRNTLAFNKFDAFRKRIEDVGNLIMKIAKDAAVAKAQLKATKMVKTFWDQNKDAMRSIEELYEKIIEDEEEAKRKAEEERRRKEEEERRKAEEERRRREQEERERKEKEREERERKEREEEQRRKEEEEKRRKREERKRKKEEEEERKRKAAEKKRQEEEAERAKRDPKNWKTLFYNTKQETKQNKGLLCVFRAFTNSLPKSDLKVVEVPMVKNIVPLEPGEELVSTVLDVTSENGHLSFPFPAVIAMPNLGGTHHFFTTVAKIRIDEEDKWTTKSAKETKIEKYKDLAECEVPGFTTMRIAFTKAVMKDTAIISTHGSVIQSSAEPKISITFPKNAVPSSRKMSIKVRHVDHHILETLKRNSENCQNLRAASHVLCIENMDGLVRFNEKIKVTMPAVDHIRKKDDKTPPMHSFAIQLGPDGHWTVCTNADTEPNEEGVVTVLRSNPLNRMVVLGMATNSEPEAEYVANRLNQHLDEHVVRLIQKQSENERSEVVVTDCVHTDDYRDRLLDLGSLGFTAGPTTPSKELLIKEGQEFTMYLSRRGNIRRTDRLDDPPENAAITFVYHSKLKCCNQEFSVEPMDVYGQHGRDFYFGHNEFYIEDKSGKAEKIHEFEIKLPRVMRAKSAVIKSRRIFNNKGILDEEVFQRIASELGDDDEWIQLASRLQMNKARIQRIETEHGGGRRVDIAFAALWDWYKSMPISGDKVDILCRNLRKMDKIELACDIEAQADEAREKARIEAEDNQLTKAFLAVVESSKVLREWQMLGRQLGVSDDDITALDIDEDTVKEKCYKVLNCWRERKGEEATLDALIEVLDEKMKIKSVADHLERHRLSGRPKTAVENSRPTTKQPHRPATRR